MIFRVAAGLARNPAPEHRWRRVAVPVATAIFTLLVLAATSVAVMVQREAERTMQRTALLATEPSPEDLLLARGYDVWGEQFVVVWIEPAGNVEPTLPPGMSRLPEPGETVVSPELDRLASVHPELAARYPNRAVLGPEGISSGDELFAYVRMPENRTLAGERAAVRARGFGLPIGADRSFPLFLEPPEEVGTPVVAGVLGFLVLPGLILLAVGLATASEVRDRRFLVLRSLGAPGRTLATLAVLETMVLAAPGLVAVTVLWGVISPHLEQVPLVGHNVVRGDLALPWWVLAAELGAGVVITALLAVTVTAVRRRGEASGPRPIPQEAAVTPLRAAPLGLAFAALVLGELSEGNLAETLNLVGVVAAIGGVPLVLPGVLRAVGGLLSRLESVPVYIVSRGLQWDPVRAARPFTGYAALVVIALVGSGYLASIRDVEATPIPTEGPEVVLVSHWLDPRPTDLARLADALGPEVVLPAGEDGNTLVVGATCSRLSPLFPGTTCDSERPFELPAETARMLAEKSFGVPGMKVRLVPPEEVATSGSALVIDNVPLKTLEERVQVAAMRTLPVPFVGSALSGVMVQSPLVPWLVGGILGAAMVLTVGCFVSLVDRLLAVRKRHRQLLNLGLVPRRLVALEAWLFVLPYCAIATVSFLAGLAICVKLLGVFSGTPMPWRDIGIVLIFVGAIGVLGTASVAVFGARSVQENPE